MQSSPTHTSEQIKGSHVYANETKRHTKDIELTARLEEKC